MGRRPSITDPDILRAARDVFLASGVHATTLEVAARAGVSEASVFRRFKTKEALFRAAMKPDLEMPQILRDLAALPSERGLVADLVAVGEAMLELVQVRMPLTMLAWSSHGGGVPEEMTGPEPFVVQIVTLIATYVEREIARGALRPVNARTFARCFVGGISQYVLTSIFGAAVALGAELSPPATYISGLVDLLVNGAGAAAGVSAPSQSRKR